MAAGNDDEFFTLACDLCSITVANTPAATQCSHGLRFYRFKIVDGELFTISKNQIEKRCDRSMPAKRRAIKRNAITESKYRHYQPCRSQRNECGQNVAGAQH